MTRKINYEQLPEHIRGGMERYIEQGISPGSFLRAVLRDKLVESFSLADQTNIERMFDIASFMYNECPAACRGSSEVIKAWQAKGGLNGILKEVAQ